MNGCCTDVVVESFCLSTLVSCSLDNDVFSLEGVCPPINGWIELFEPGVSQDKTITTEVSNVESHLNSFVSLNYEKVAKVSDGACLVYSAIYIVNDFGGRKDSGSKVKGIDGSLINEVVGSATIKERFHLGLLMPHIQVNVDCH